MEAIQQFDPELDLSAIAGVKETSCEEDEAGDAYQAELRQRMVEASAANAPG